jgi:EAL domain-containing protein (putative c-di-GMP-specific phosphodiesterase class I)
LQIAAMLNAPQSDSPPTVTYLEHYPESGEGAHRIRLDHFPFFIGRNSSAHYCINSRHVSKEHAQIFSEGGQIRVRDLKSTNGTFVNGQRIREVLLHHGDILHVGHKEFRFVQDSDAGQGAELVLTDHRSGPPPGSAIQNAEFLKELVQRQGVRTLFQPIFDLRTGAVLGFESLGRGTHEKLTSCPAFLFSLAAQFDLAPQLSALFRRVAVQEAEHLPPGAPVFFNLHPSELGGAALWKSLEEVRQALAGTRQVVVELHEEAVADIRAMRRLLEEVHGLGFSLAYDDFGAGNARLSELADVPPDFIKLDKSLIHAIHQAPGRQKVVRALTRVTTDLGIGLIAEGIEAQEEADLCVGLGCHFGQGYLLGRPQPVSSGTTLQQRTDVYPTV